MFYKFKYLLKLMEKIKSDIVLPFSVTFLLISIVNKYEITLVPSLPFKMS